MTYKSITCLLLLLFAFDSLAILDVVEVFVFGRHAQVTQTEAMAEAHLHNPEQREHRSQLPDSCTLCACCVSGLSMLVASFAFDNSISLLSTITMHDPLAASWSEDHIFHPPRYIS